MTPKVLFIGHDASRTGAPIALLRLLSWTKTNSDLAFEILLREGGALEDEFRALGRTLRFGAPARGSGFLTRIGNRLGRARRAQEAHVEGLLQRYADAGIGLIYSNTITNGRVLADLAPLGCPVITHVHELETWIQRYGEENFEQVRRHTDHFIAVSGAVRENLVEVRRIPAEKLDVVHPFLPIPEDVERLEEAAAGVRSRLGIPEDAFVIGGSGQEIWRKGKDLFVQLGIALTRRSVGRPVHFLWVGGNNSAAEFSRLQFDVRQAGVVDRFHFVEVVENPWDYFAAFDLFAMTSREDPYPYVNLEVACLGKPIVCFDRAGGTPEFVEDDAGCVVPYGDVTAMADRALELMNDETTLRRFGARAAEKVRERHSVDVAAPQIHSILARFQ